MARKPVAPKARKTRSGPHPRAERMRYEIVQAAAGAFARRGFRATTMNEIAAAAGYTAASLYTYFKSKDEIFVALFQELVAEMLSTFDEPVPSGLDFGQRVELLLLRQYELAERRRDAFFLLISNMSEMPKGCGAPADGHQQFHRRFTEWMRENATAKDLGETSVDDAARVLMGVSQIWFKEWLLGVRKGRLSDAAPVVTSFFLRGVSGAYR